MLVKGQKFLRDCLLLMVNRLCISKKLADWLQVIDFQMGLSNRSTGEEVIRRRKVYVTLFCPVIYKSLWKFFGRAVKQWNVKCFYNVGIKRESSCILGSSVRSKRTMK